MLECKFKIQTNNVKSENGINRYMLGCKCGPHSNIRQEHVRELIDTCWDVNANSATNTNTGTSELIDTCWANTRADESGRVG